MSTITDFQLGKISDNQGRFIHDIWQLNDFWLEHDHKYVQWLFPIDSQTKFNRHAPMLSLEDQAAFKGSSELKHAQKKSLDLMLRFFGMRWEGGVIVPVEQLNMREHIWLKRAGHNHLRISRIIRSLSLCDQFELSVQFQQAMLDAAEQYGEVCEESKGYWRSANEILA
jgi:hypothetical protein